MKLRKLRKELYRSIFEHNLEKEKKIWLKILKKSVKHKHTADVQ